VAIIAGGAQQVCRSCIEGIECLRNRRIRRTQIFDAAAQCKGVFSARTLFCECGDKPALTDTGFTGKKHKRSPPACISSGFFKPPQFSLTAKEPP